MKFKVYVDYTNDGRPFYVGKGNQQRVNRIKRNDKHSFVVQQFGIDRRVVFETDDQQQAFIKEIELIAELKTFVLDSEIGCNLDRGGHIGSFVPRPHTEEWKTNMSQTMKERMKGNTNGRGNKGRKMNQEWRDKLAAAKKGKVGNRTGKLTTPYGWRVDGALRTLSNKKLARTLGWSLTDDEARKLLVSPCHFCGEEPKLPYPGTISLKDPAFGFSPENSVSCCQRCSDVKGTLSENEYVEWAARVAQTNLTRMSKLK